MLAENEKGTGIGEAWVKVVSQYHLSYLSNNYFDCILTVIL